MSNTFYYELIKEIYSVRKSPSTYADKILGYKQYFKGTILRIPGSKGGVQTEEGFAAYQEAAQVLKSSKPLDEIVPSKALGKIANDYLERMKTLDPDKIGEIDLDSIIKKYGTYTGTFNNIMDFGSPSPELVVINLLANDGDPSRSNREFVLNEESKKVGIASGQHVTYGYLTIIVSCTDFKNTIDKDDNESYGGLLKIEVKTEPSPKPQNVPEEKTSTKEKDENKDPNVLSCERRERLVIERGKKKKKIVLMTKYKDGKMKKEVKYILL